MLRRFLFNSPNFNSPNAIPNPNPNRNPIPNPNPNPIPNPIPNPNPNPIIGIRRIEIWRIEKTPILQRYFQMEVSGDTCFLHVLVFEVEDEGDTKSSVC